MSLQQLFLTMQLSSRYDKWALISFAVKDQKLVVIVYFLCVYEDAYVIY